MLNLDSDKTFFEKHKEATTLKPLKDFVEKLKLAEIQKAQV